MTPLLQQAREGDAVGSQVWRYSPQPDTETFWQKSVIELKGAVPKTSPEQKRILKEYSEGLAAAWASHNKRLAQLRAKAVRALTRASKRAKKEKK